MRNLLIVGVLVLGCGGSSSKESSCSTSAECTTASPYCSAETCAATCSDDTECPGFGQAASQRFCESGSCAACRTAMNDCSGTTPVCAEGECRRCERNDECGSGVCAGDGSCVPETSIIYTAPNGSATAMCTPTDPCSLERGVQLTPPRQFILLASGTHTLSGSLTIAGTRSLIGTGTRPVITNSANGPILKMALGADVTIDHIELTGAKNSLTPPQTDAFAIQIPDGTITVRVKDSTFTNNAGAAIDGRKCTLEVTSSSFTSNNKAISIVDSKGTIDRSTFTSNTGTALFLDAGLFLVRNNFLTRNKQAVDLFANAGTTIEFNTMADNEIGLTCQSFDGPLAMPNNLLARNAMNAPFLTMCSFTNSVTTGTDIAPLKFKSPDVAPFDYHILAGSSVIDLAATSATVVDFDGEARPGGSAPDIGADELH